MTPKDNLLRVIRHDHPQWVPSGGQATAWVGPPIVERPGEPVKDDFGVQWALEEGAHGGTYPAHGGHTISDLSKWRQQITFPDVEGADWQSVTDRAGEFDRQEVLLEGSVEFGLFERSWLLLGMDEAMIAYMLQRKLMDELVAAIADYKIKLIRRFNDAAGGLDLVWYGDDWGTQNDLFIPPEVWRRIIKPHTKRIYDCIRDCGAMVNQHSCGKIDSIFADMVEMGCDIWNPCQPCNDLAGLKKQFAGKITFAGAIDSQFVLDRPGVTTDEVRAEVRRRIDELAEGGGYVAAPSHGVPYDEEIINAMDDEIATYGRAFYAEER